MNLNSREISSSGQRGSWDLGELASGDYPKFDALIWREKFIELTLLFLTSFETMLFELRARD